MKGIKLLKKILFVISIILIFLFSACSLFDKRCSDVIVLGTAWSYTSDNFSIYFNLSEDNAKYGELCIGTVIVNEKKYENVKVFYSRGPNFISVWEQGAIDDFLSFKTKCFNDHIDAYNVQYFNGDEDVSLDDFTLTKIS